jgi:hypothetical protein
MVTVEHVAHRIIVLVWHPQNVLFVQHTALSHIRHTPQAREHGGLWKIPKWLSYGMWLVKWIGSKHGKGVPPDFQSRQYCTVSVYLLL